MTTLTDIQEELTTTISELYENVEFLDDRNNQILDSNINEIDEILQDQDMYIKSIPELLTQLDDQLEAEFKQELNTAKTLMLRYVEFFEKQNSAMLESSISELSSKIENQSKLIVNIYRQIENIDIKVVEEFG